MTLNDYLSLPDAPSLTALSEKLGVSKGRLSQLRHKSDWPPELAISLEEKTDGMVDASKLSPTVARARSGKAAA